MAEFLAEMTKYLINTIMEGRRWGRREEDDGVSRTDVVIHGPADGVGAFFREVDCNSGFAACSGSESWGGPRLQPAFLAQSSSSRSLGHEIKLLRRVFAISSWSSCSASLSRRRPNHGRAHLATVVPPPFRPPCRNHHSPSDNAAVTSARVVAASSEVPESLPLTVAAIFRFQSRELHNGGFSIIRAVDP
ncbi:hypothetical protein YC2023_064211 [Brassica napus]